MPFQRDTPPQNTNINKYACKSRVILMRWAKRGTLFRIDNYSYRTNQNNSSSKLPKVLGFASKGLWTPLPWHWMRLINIEHGLFLHNAAAKTATGKHHCQLRSASSKLPKNCLIDTRWYSISHKFFYTQYYFHAQIIINDLLAFKHQNPKPVHSQN